MGRKGICGSLLLAALAACGGGDDSGGSTPVTIPSPAPTPSPPPPPSPTPTPTGTLNLLNLNESVQFEGFLDSYQYRVTKSGDVSDYQFYTASASDNVGYDRSKDAFSIWLQTSPNIGGQPGTAKQSFLYVPRSLLVGNTSTFVSGTVNDGPDNVYFSMLSIGSYNPQLSLMYSGFGTIRYVQVEDSNMDVVDFRPFSYGFRSEELPQSGLVTLQGLLRGEAIGSDSNRIYDLQGSVEIIFNFETRRFEGGFTVTGVDRISGLPVDFGTLAITPPGPRPDNVVSADLEDNNLNSIGGMQAYFAGPNAEELYGIVDKKLPDPNSPNRLVSVKFSFAAKPS